MRLLITGANRFLGSHVSRALSDDGHPVGALLRTTSDAAGLDNRIEVFRTDGSTPDIDDIVGRFRPDAVVHLASKFLASHGSSDIDELIDSNLRFGCNILEAMHRHDVAHLINFGTAWQHFETEAYRPVSLYAATKQAFEDLLAFYCDATGLTAITLKLTDTYGPGDPRPKVLPLLVGALRTGQPLDMSQGQQIVNFVHVEDVVSAVRVALGRAAALPRGTQEAFAIRSEEALPLTALVALLERVSGRALNVAWGARAYRDREVMQPWLGPILPGWQARKPLEDGLKELVG